MITSAAAPTAIKETTIHTHTCLIGSWINEIIIG